MVTKSKKQRLTTTLKDSKRITEKLSALHEKAEEDIEEVLDELDDLCDIVSRRMELTRREERQLDYVMMLIVEIRGKIAKGNADRATLIKLARDAIDTLDATRCGERIDTALEIKFETKAKAHVYGNS